MPTVREIAELAGVAVSTVSLVLNNKTGVAEATRRAVLEARDQLATREEDIEREGSSPIARLNESLSLVVLHPPVLPSSYVFSEVLRGIQTAAETYHIQLRLVANDPQASGQHVAQLYFTDPTLRPDGVIVFGAQQHEPLLEQAQHLGIPCVVLGRDASKYPVSGIGRDEERCAYQATQHLLGLGHQAIAFIGGEEQYDFVHNRVLGYRRALDEAEIRLQPAWIQLGDGAPATQTLLQNAPDVTAVLFVNDTYAAQGLPVLQAAGLPPPRRYVRDFVR